MMRHVARVASLALLFRTTTHAGQPFTERTAGASTATDTLVVGHPVLGRAAPHVGADSTAILTTQAGTRRRSVASVSTIARRGDVYVIEQSSRSVRGQLIDSIEVDALTLAPRRHVEVFPWLRSEVRFANGMVTGSYTDSTGAHAVSIPLTANVFDYSTLHEVLAMLPRSKVYDAVIRTFDVSSRTEKTVKVRVDGSDSLEWNGTTVPTTRMTMDFGAWQVENWLATADGRQLQWRIQQGGREMLGVTVPGA